MMPFDSKQIDGLPSGVRALPRGLRDAWVGAASAALAGEAGRAAAKREADAFVALLSRGLSDIGLTSDALEVRDSASSHPLVVALLGDRCEEFGGHAAKLLHEKPPAGERGDVAAWLADRFAVLCPGPAALPERGLSGSAALHADAQWRTDRFELELTAEAKDAVARAMSRRERLAARGDSASFDAVIEQLRKDGFDDYVTPEGYLKIKVRAARSGTQVYSNGFDTWGEYRPEDEVGSAESLASWGYKPFTNDHPPDFVGVHNWAEYAVGVIGDDARLIPGPDGDSYVEVTIVVYGFDALVAIRSGKVELSAGYSANMRRESGRDSRGREYAFRQTDIFINHLSLVDRGRAGPLARVFLDGFAWQVPLADAVGTHTDKDDKTMPTPSDDKIKVKLTDGVEVEMTKAQADAWKAEDDKRKADADALAKRIADAEEQAKAAIEQAKAEGASEAVDSTKPQFDAFKAQLDAMDGKLGDLVKAKAETDAQLVAIKAENDRLKADATNRERAEVIDTVRKVCPKLKIEDSASLAEIKAAALIDLAPHFKAAVEQYRTHGDAPLATFVDTLFAAEVGSALKAPRASVADSAPSKPARVFDLNAARAEALGKAG